jgi:hypothetical protein
MELTFTSPTRQRSRPGLVSTLFAIVAAVGLLALSAQPAGAKVEPRGATWRGGCDITDGGVYYRPYGQVFMQEYGKSGVRQMRAQFRLWRTNETGWSRPKLTRTYRSIVFPNDNRSFWVYHPTNQWHQWTDVFGFNEYRLDAKMVWDRSWRRDFTYTPTLAYCRGGGL